MHESQKTTFRNRNPYKKTKVWRCCCTTVGHFDEWSYSWGDLQSISGLAELIRPEVWCWINEWGIKFAHIAGRFRMIKSLKINHVLPISTPMPAASSYPWKFILAELLHKEELSYLRWINNCQTWTIFTCIIGFIILKNNFNNVLRSNLTIEIYQ